MNKNRIYRGRFAPSPTGPLHFGSMIAAIGSYLEARSRQGEWLLRIENIDPPREPSGAISQILRTLEAFDMQWDGPVYYQHERLERYQQAIETLFEQGQLYSCQCSRKQIAMLNEPDSPTLVYPGTCRDRHLPPSENHALRVVTDGSVILFEDRIQGRQAFLLQKESGDFVLRRADGLFSYQLAVAIDDAEQQITEVVRGCDLLGSSARQMHIQHLLGLNSPDYAHLPVAQDPQTGKKLSKQNFARPVDDRHPAITLWQVLDFLGQNPPPALQSASLSTLWQWALSHWQLKFVPRTAAIDVIQNETKDAQVLDT